MIIAAPGMFFPVRRSPVADQLPPDAFFARAGQRVVEHSRYHLDLRHPAAVAPR